MKIAKACLQNIERVLREFGGMRRNTIDVSIYIYNSDYLEC